MHVCMAVLFLFIHHQDSLCTLDHIEQRYVMISTDDVSCMTDLIFILKVQVNGNYLLSAYAGIQSGFFSPSTYKTISAYDPGPFQAFSFCCVCRLFSTNSF